MKVLTEFSGTVIRLAAQAEQEVRASLPAASATTAPAEGPQEASEAPAPVADGADVETAGGEATDASSTSEAEKKAPEAATAEDSDETKAALEEAIGQATGISGDRLTRLREALSVAGKQAKEIRLVRVYSAESPVAGAKVVGEHQFVVDLMPKTMKPSFGRPGRDDKGGRRGDRGRRGPGGKGAREEGPLDGAFSMDSVKSDKGGGGRRGR